MWPPLLLQVERAVAETFGISIEELRGPRRPMYVAHPRHVVWFLAHEILKFSYSRIAYLYGRDHTTIMHGIARVRKSEDLGRSMQIVAKIPHINPLGDAIHISTDSPKDGLKQ